MNLADDRKRRSLVKDIDSKVRQMQASSEQLENENLKMEERILALKQMMKKEKDERVRNGGSRWKSSIITATNQSPFLKETRSDKKKTANKIQVLTNEPISAYVVKRKSKDNKKILFPCGQCENVQASSECIECCEYYCLACYKNFHARGALRKHTFRPIDPEKQSQAAKTESFNEINKNRNLSSKQGTTDASDLRENGYDTTPKGLKKGGALLQGSYDEKESAAYFAEAIKNWRMAGGSGDKGTRTQQGGLSEKESRSCGTDTGWTSRSARISSPSEVKLNFGSSLTYADRLALKKNKKDPAAYIGYRYPAHKRNLELDRRLIGSPSGSGVSSASQRTQYSSQSNPFPVSLASPGSSQRSSRNPQRTSSSSNRVDAMQQKQVLSIHRVPSTEDVSGSYDEEENESPVIDDISNDESTERRETRQTLSQMGRLTIVELNFSDAELEWSGVDQRRSKSATVMLSPSNTPSPQGNKGIPGYQGSKPTLTPRPPHHSAPGSHKARRKIVGNRSKPKNKQSDPENSLKTKSSTNVPRKVWSSVPVYKGLDDFFLAGVDQSNDPISREEVQAIVISSNDEQGVVYEQCPTLSTTDDLGVWRPDSSLAYDADSISRRDSGFKSEETMHLRRPVPEVTMTVESPDGSVMVDRSSFSEESKTGGQQSFYFTTEAYEEPQDSKFLKSVSALSSPRISLSDYDFLRAPPPMSKGDNFTKIHRASTVTIFGLSPQPPDLWNDDSEIELSGLSPKRPASPMSVGQPDEDIIALEELAREAEIKGKPGREMFRSERKSLPFWEEEDLSIEDKDEGSGLSSPAETELHYEGDESSDEERAEDEQNVLRLV